MNEVFKTNDWPYNLRNPRILASKHKSSIKYGFNTIPFTDPQIWPNIRLEMKNL